MPNKFDELFRIIFGKAKNGLSYLLDECGSVIEDMKDKPMSVWDRFIMTISVVLVFGMIAIGSILFNDSKSQDASYLLSLIIVGYLVGFCETHRAKFWGFVLFLVNIYLWVSTLLD
ncbi:MULTISPECIES: hypothetical protein [Xanthomonas]|uniref:hypothetical protein n=1 Tax=Xanthomonas TaxID=338 RepID=UPI0004A7E38A|nr:MULTISPECIES: hypothetical protein [Xanthomonas]MCE4513826.1 hypothetical protein [Xanthomonas hortorum pv. vitians]MCE4522362.1 hypothetical protein [Xanthomonas hortorum pv. vitians]QTK40642.1 hypothetical protein XcgCFBP7119R_08315 [Xanthomonas citri pv. glycines]